MQEHPTSGTVVSSPQGPAKPSTVSTEVSTRHTQGDFQNPRDREQASREKQNQATEKEEESPYTSQQQLWMPGDHGAKLEGKTNSHFYKPR